MIEAVVFDMDGLLVDSEPLWQNARVEAFEPGELRWTDADQERVMGQSTRGWALMIADKLDHKYSLEEIIDRVIGQMVEYYHQRVPLLPGAREVIELLKGRYRLGLASGAPYRLLNAVLESAGWTGVFAEVLSSDDLQRGKPAPDIYLEITRRLGVPAWRIAVFEDSANGIIAAHEASNRVIAVPSHYFNPPADALQKAALVLPTLSEFTLDMLERL
ncbi:MAG TPA: HAD family phosphatase [Aggregatilineaceae bacterium]|jgi:HAD superfamily hydrolase (TIGR01509 family)|nr:HAD family phosphatase [Aggregatilineaceae bacterium]